MAGLCLQFFLFFLVSFFVWSESKNIEKTESRLESEFAPEKSASQKNDESFEDKNSVFQVMSDSSSAFSTETEQIIDQKVLDIVKNPVNADLNKLPVEVIEKIAEGGVTTPKDKPMDIANNSEKAVESVTSGVTAGGTEDSTATTAEVVIESTTAYVGKEAGDLNKDAVTVVTEKIPRHNYCLSIKKPTKLKKLRWTIAFMHHQLEGSKQIFKGTPKESRIPGFIAQVKKLMYRSTKTISCFPD